MVIVMNQDRRYSWKNFTFHKNLTAVTTMVKNLVGLLKKRAYITPVFELQGDFT